MTNSWLPPIIAISMGLLWAGSFMAYTLAFRWIGPLQLTPRYLIELAFLTPFIPGLVLSLVVSLLRMWLFGFLGPQRTWFLEPVIFAAGSVAVVGMLREGLRYHQWVGVGLVLSGMLLIVRK